MQVLIHKKNIDQVDTWQLEQDAKEDFRKLVCLVVMSIFIFRKNYPKNIFLFYTLYVSSYQTPIIKTTNKY